MSSLEGAAISCVKDKLSTQAAGFREVVLVGALDGQQERVANRE